MKEISIAAVGLLVGLLLGGVGPRAELGVLQQGLDERVQTAKKCQSGVGRDLATFMGTGVGPVTTAAGAQ